MTQQSERVAMGDSALAGKAKAVRDRNGTQEVHRPRRVAERPEIDQERVA